MFDHSSVLGPSAQRLDEALESMVWAVPIALGFMPRASSMAVKYSSSRALRTTSSGGQFHGIGGFDGIKNNTVHDVLWNGLGRLRAACELGDAIHPGGCLRIEFLGLDEAQLSDWSALLDM